MIVVNKTKKTKKPKERSLDPNEDKDLNNLMNGLGKIVAKKDGTIEGSKVINSKKIGKKDNINENMKNNLDYDKNLNANAIAFDQGEHPNGKDFNEKKKNKKNMKKE